MYHRSIFIVIAVVFKVVYSLADYEKVEPVELFHVCIDPETPENDPIKSPVVLMHGLLVTHKSYDGIDRLIANRTKRRVCSLDLRNHGDSPWSNRSDVIAMTADIHHFLNAQNITKVNLIGESLGGRIAIYYALNNPDRVDSIVVEDMHPKRLRKTIFLGIKFFIRQLQNMIDSQPKDMNEDQVYSWGKKHFDEILEKIKVYQDIPKDAYRLFGFRLIGGKWQLKTNMDFLIRNINNLHELVTETSGIYTGPSIFIYGIESAFKVDDEKDNILKMFPNARFYPIENVGHLIHHVYREFDDIVVNFLNEIN